MLYFLAVDIAVFHLYDEFLVAERPDSIFSLDNVIFCFTHQFNGIRIPDRFILEEIELHIAVNQCPAHAVSQVEPSLDPSLDAWVDAGAFRQILLNLLENAVKYGPPDQIIDVRLRKGPGGTVHLLVEDEGRVRRLARRIRQVLPAGVACIENAALPPGADQGVVQVRRPQDRRAVPAGWE